MDHSLAIPHGQSGESVKDALKSNVREPKD
jgi:hypothetical protein